MHVAVDIRRTFGDSPINSVMHRTQYLYNIVLYHNKGGKKEFQWRRMGSMRYVTHNNICVGR